MSVPSDPPAFAEQYDDFANNGVDPRNPHQGFVQYPNDTPSFVDTPGTPVEDGIDIHVDQTFTTCIHSEDPCGNCENSKCCIRWRRILIIKKGNVMVNKVERGVKWCEKGDETQSKF